MDYNHITNFLEKFKKIIFQKEEVKENVIAVISKEIKHSINNDDIKIKNGFIYINGSPLFRGEVLIHKKNILEELKKILPNNIFLDIK